MLATDELPPGSTETSWYLDVNHFAKHTPAVHGLLTAWALYGGLATLVLLAFGTYLWSRRRPDAPRYVAGTAWGGVAALAGLALNQVVSHAVARPRPYDALPHVEVLVAKARDYSFPSDHAVIAGALATALTLVSWRVGAAAWALALSLAFARVYVGAHYPLDVVAGLALGALVAGVLGIVARPLLTRTARWLTGTPLAVLVRRAATG